MIYKIADNVITPLGDTTAQNYRAVKASLSALRLYENHWGLPEPFVASLFTEEQTQQLSIDGLTRFEALAATSAMKAIAECELDVAQAKVVFILSTTKANIETSDSLPAESAVHIARYLGFVTQPIVVCNACISGVSAIMLAQRLLESGSYDYAVVTGADVQCPFTMAGFQSLKAVSAEPCRPFDIDRMGLNLGEAASTIIFSREGRGETCWAVEQSAVRNDAFSITTPSRSADGALSAMRGAGLTDAADRLAFINVHGTGTLFNDQMEATAISRSGLSHVPVNALKGYFGHTLGAAGILETVISMAAADDQTLLGTKGYQEAGVVDRIQVSAHHQPLNGLTFGKMISGFGGCNGALLLKKTKPVPAATLRLPRIRKTHSLRVAPPTRIVDLYKTHITDYARFYKMDALCRLGFVAAELLLKENEGTAVIEREQRQACLDSAEGEQTRTKFNNDDMAIVLFNHSSSILTDREFHKTISNPEGSFPSPSLFVYTLPNIVAGEIAIRHHLQSETSFYILPERDDSIVSAVIALTFLDPSIHRVLGGWIDYEDDEHFEAELYIAEKN